MQRILWRLQKDDRYEVLKINLETMKMEEDVGEVLSYISEKITEKLHNEIISSRTQKEFETVFEKRILKKPLILILDEFDALAENAITAIVGAFRNICNVRRDQDDKTTGEKDYLLHGVALIGVRTVLGVENATGSPFNVQRSLIIPNLTFEEVEGMFRCYEEESGQKVEDEVIARLYCETQGQPGLVSWFGELLTEGWEEYRPDKNRPIGIEDFSEAYAAGLNILPNNTVLNIISKVKKEPYKDFILEMFQTRGKNRVQIRRRDY